MIALLLLAVALAMDAFAVALCQGAASRSRAGHALKVGASFGVAQGLMPLGGWALGVAFAAWVSAIDHWVAFLLLGFLGIRMIRQGLSGETDCDAPLLSGFALVAAAIATSIDAAAAGVTLPALGTGVALACLLIGGVTFALCFAGVLGGGRLGARLGNRAEIFGGVVLVGLGCKILAEHVWLV